MLSKLVLDDFSCSCLKCYQKLCFIIVVLFVLMHIGKGLHLKEKMPLPITYAT